VASGDKEGAVPYVQALVEAAPQDPGPRARLAGLLTDLHRNEEARTQALWMWTKTPSQPPAAAFFKAQPQWRALFADLPSSSVLERLRALASEGDFMSLGNELPKFRPSNQDEAGWALYLRGRLAEGQGHAAEAIKTLSGVTAPPDAQMAAVWRSGAALPKSGLPGKEVDRVEASLAALPTTFEGRQKALVAILRWHARQPDEVRATFVAAALMAGGTAQTDACEYLYGRGWDRWLAGDRRGAEGDWRLLIKTLPSDSDFSLASRYSLLRLGRLTGREAAEFKVSSQRDDRYGYFGYRMRGAMPPVPPTPGTTPPLPAARDGSHQLKAGLLLSIGLPADAVDEFQMALQGEKEASAQLGLLWAQSQAKAQAADFAGSIRTARILYPRVFNENGDRLAPEAWRTLYPTPYRDAVQRSADASDVPYVLACSVIRQESLWDVDAVSHSGARGLMQLMPPTAAALARRCGLLFNPPDCYADPSWNTRAGTAFLRELIDRYHRRLDLALAAYNAGPGRVDDWLARPRSPKEPDLFVESIPFKETRSYVRRIMLNCWEYDRLYDDLSAPLAPGSLELAPVLKPPPMKQK
jgi:soluble lytic murein transglycosylase-like protein